MVQSELPGRHEKQMVRSCALSAVKTSRREVKNVVVVTNVVSFRISV